MFGLARFGLAKFGSQINGIRHIEFWLSYNEFKVRFGLAEVWFG